MVPTPRATSCAGCTSQDEGSIFAPLCNAAVPCKAVRQQGSKLMHMADPVNMECGSVSMGATRHHAGAAAGRQPPCCIVWSLAVHPGSLLSANSVPTAPADRPSLLPPAPASSLLPPRLQP